MYWTLEPGCIGFNDVFAKEAKGSSGESLPRAFVSAVRDINLLTEHFNRASVRDLADR